MPKRKFRTVCRRVINRIVIIKKLKGNYRTTWARSNNDRIWRFSQTTSEAERTAVSGSVCDSGADCTVYMQMYNNLFRLQLCSDNATHFKKLAQSGANGYNERMPVVQTVLQTSIETLKGNIKKLQEVAPKYDYDEKTPGNGYRWVIFYFLGACIFMFSFFQLVTLVHTSVFFLLFHQNMPKFFCPNMALNELREIPLAGAIPMEGKNGELVMVPEPSAHTGPRPVQYRILSTVHRQNMSSSALSTTHPPSKYLVLHCHGGGYVATSSKSHETYLRQWAKALNCPVVSVEYSLAPENPFPRPTEEVLFAYSWIINNPAAVGWTGEKIVMVGDSAGGNLIMSVNIRLVQLNIKRQPDGLVLCYTPFLFQVSHLTHLKIKKFEFFQYLPSPSRMLSVMDPLLHMGVVLRCVAAYTGAYGAQINNNKLRKSRNSIGGTDMYASHRSLQEYVNEVQKTRVDFSGGSQSIVSLVQKSHDNGGFAKTNGNSYYKKETKTEIEIVKKTEEVEKDGCESEDDALETTSIASVQVDADPFHIQLNHTLHDDDLISFLSHHPITKDAMSHTPDISEDDIELLDSPIELGLEATENLVIEEEHEENKIGDEVSTPSTESIPEVHTTKRPRLLQMLSSVTSRESRDNSQTAPSTPSQQPKPLTHSNSMNGFNPPVHKRSLSQSLADTAASTAAYALDNLQDWFERPLKEKQKLDRTVSRKDEGDILEEVLEEDEQPSHLLELVSAGTVPRDPLISPMYADNETICQLPPCYFMACHMDPLLDDTISFAGKLRDAGGKVMSVDLLSSVPHGFLNFTLISPECKKSGQVCIGRLKEALGIIDE
ncbi:Protein CBG14512 [Caenorhabditis briggsae]|uniref:Protein CBG14512 n=1 Tax=Caenorhabditis briggsae TaxID=6238 RepID=A8XK33_CAEBR|nr:Protein CBG14512 [Caenorhabditis briggsae]CAP33009.2 Protein CBG14512 [Caenorhabditis briggsae]